METSKLVKQGMDESRTQATGEVGEAITEQYMGPSAARIANLIPHKVSFEQGWFRTTTAICHGGTSDGLAFRQRPDGNGIDARCHTGDCPLRHGHNAPGGAHRTAHLDGLRAGERRG